MSISLSRCPVLDIDDVPNSNSLPNVQMEEIIRSKPSRAGSSSIDNNFVGFDTGGSMSSSGRWRCSGGCIKANLL
jgi:hypothetical protein